MRQRSSEAPRDGMRTVWRYGVVPVCTQSLTEGQRVTYQILTLPVEHYYDVDFLLAENKRLQQSWFTRVRGKKEAFGIHANEGSHETSQCEGERAMGAETAGGG